MKKLFKKKSLTKVQEKKLEPIRVLCKEIKSCQECSEFMHTRLPEGQVLITCKLAYPGVYMMASQFVLDDMFKNCTIYKIKEVEK